MTNDAPLQPRFAVALVVVPHAAAVCTQARLALRPVEAGRCTSLLNPRLRGVEWGEVKRSRDLREPEAASRPQKTVR